MPGGYIDAPRAPFIVQSTVPVVSQVAVGMHQIHRQATHCTYVSGSCHLPLQSASKYSSSVICAPVAALPICYGVSVVSRVPAFHNDLIQGGFRNRSVDLPGKRSSRVKYASIRPAAFLLAPSLSAQPSIFGRETLTGCYFGPPSVAQTCEFEPFRTFEYPARIGQSVQQHPISDFEGSIARIGDFHPLTIFDYFKVGRDFLCRSFLYRSLLYRIYILIHINCVDSRTASSMCAAAVHNATLCNHLSQAYLSHIVATCIKQVRDAFYSDYFPICAFAIRFASLAIRTLRI